MSETSEIKTFLNDPKRLGEAVYNYWVSLMITDKVEGIENSLSWATIPDDAREDFVEAIKTKVCDVFLEYDMRDEAFTARFNDAAHAASMAAETLVERPCYICSRNIVRGPATRVSVCDTCKTNYWITT